MRHTQTSIIAHWRTKNQSLTDMETTWLSSKTCIGRRFETQKVCEFCYKSLICTLDKKVCFCQISTIICCYFLMCLKITDDGYETKCYVLSHCAVAYHGRRERQHIFYMIYKQLAISFPFFCCSITGSGFGFSGTNILKKCQDFDEMRKENQGRRKI